MISHQATRAAALAFCASMMLLIGGAAEAADEMKCRKAVEQAWAEVGVDKSDVVSTTARDRAVGGGKMTEAAVHARLKSCSGMLVVSLSKMCHLRDVYTTGDCRLPGVPAYP